MHLTEQDIKKFQKLYREKFNIDLDYNSAYEKLSKLVRQMEIVYQPITQEQVDELRKRDAMALAELIYDVYEAEKQLKKKKP